MNNATAARTAIAAIVEQKLSAMNLILVKSFRTFVKFPKVVSFLLMCCSLPARDLACVV